MPLDIDPKEGPRQQVANAAIKQAVESHDPVALERVVNAPSTKRLTAL
jgi:hypothetical protein